MSEATLTGFLTNQGYTSIQMQRNSIGHFEVQAQINGVSTRLIVDTGASRTVIDRNSIERLNLPITESEVMAGGVGTSEHAVAYGVIDSLGIQSLNISSFPVGVIDLSHVNQSLKAHGAGSVEGEIGGDLMNSRAAVIDYQHAVLYLRTNETNSV